MKKIFTLFASVLVAASAMAQAVTLDANRIVSFYKAYDGTAFATDATKHPIAYWRVTKSDGTHKNYELFPITNDSGGGAIDMNDITLTKDYVDSETGFRVPAGRYTTLCCNDYISSSQTRRTIQLYNGGSSPQPVSNLRKIIIYVAGIGAGKADDGTLYQDGIRLNGMNIYDNGSKLTNAVSGDKATDSWLTRYPYNGVITSADNVDVYDSSKGTISSNTFTQDKLFRLVVDFKTAHNPDDAHDGYDHDGSDNVSNNVGDGSPEQTIDRACIDKTTGKAKVEERVYNVCHKFDDPDGDGTTGTGGAKGYYSYDWTWSKTVGQVLQIKKSYNLFGIALICGDDGAKTYISDVSQTTKAVWTEIGTTAINTVNAANEAVATPAKSIENGRVVISKNGHKYTAAGAMLK